MSLNNRQQAFVDEYLVDFNATQAAIRAGYNEQTAGAQASRLLKNVKVAKAIEERTNQKQSKLIADQTEILEMLTSIARGNEQPFNSTVKKIINGEVEKKSTEGASTPPTEERLKALELLGKANAMFTDKQQVESVETVQFIDDVEDE